MTNDTGYLFADAAMTGSVRIRKKRRKQTSLPCRANGSPPTKDRPQPDLIAAIDPGTTQSALVVWDGSRIHDKCKIPNGDMFQMLDIHYGRKVQLAIEMVASFGMPVGKAVFETVRWIGRFEQFWNDIHKMRAGTLERGMDVVRIYRTDVKMHFCRSVRAKDGNIRQALIDRFGSPGTIKVPGVTHGLAGDTWQAFALAVHWGDKTRVGMGEIPF